MKNNPAARAGLAANMPAGVNPDTALSALEWLAWLAVVYSRLKKYFPYVKYTVLVFLLYWLYFKVKPYFGPTEDLGEEPLVYG